MIGIIHKILFVDLFVVIKNLSSTSGSPKISFYELMLCLICREAICSL